MKNKILIAFLLITSSNCLAIGQFKAGDTLYVWAKNGLNIREQPSDTAKVLGRAKNGSIVISVNGRADDYPYSVLESKKPKFELTG